MKHISRPSNPSGDARLLPDCEVDVNEPRIMNSEQVQLPPAKKCDCHPSIEYRVLWTQNVEREDGRIFAWLTLYYSTDTTHTPEGHADPRFEVESVDPVVKEGPGRLNTITETSLGKWLTSAWIALNPERYAALPKTHRAWLDWEQQMYTESITEDLVADGAEVSGMSTEQRIKLWRAMCTVRTEARELTEASQVFSPGAGFEVFAWVKA